MKNSIKVVALLGLSAATLSASGWRIPEQSLNSTALAAAYVAGAHGADASYYNPANMVWNDDASEMEMALTYIGLSKIKYTDAQDPSINDKSKGEDFLVPTFHYVSPAVGNWRFGLSLVAPGGLSKRWDGTFQKLKAEEFTLTILELNPTVAYKINDQFAVGFGLRGVYSSGEINMEFDHPRAGKLYDNEMEADSFDFGYNLALSYKPIENLTLSTTYRSKVDLTVSGDATTTLSNGALDISGDVKTTVPLPASLAIAAAYTMSKTTIELVYEKTYWSAYDSLQFKFENPIANQLFGAKQDKNWEDVDSYRIGVSHQATDDLRIMAGFAIDKNPVPDEHVSFELPDSDAKLYSIGLEYAINSDMKIGLAYLYDEKESRTVNTRTATNPLGAYGTFEDASAHLVTASFKYKF